MDKNTDELLIKYYENLSVAISENDSFYCEHEPFHPSEGYPEYTLGSICNCKNPAYAAVRSCLQSLGMDMENYGKVSWNPFMNIIKPGNTVVLKPNFVLSRHYSEGNLFSIITHPSVLRAIIDYVYISLKGEGEIIIADAPQMDCDFEELLKATRLTSIKDLYQLKYGFEIKILDLRDFWLEKNKTDDTFASTEKRHSLIGDPKGSVLVNLSKKSKFYGLENLDNIYGADYNRNETIRHHHNDIHEYIVSKTIMDADVVISVPKLKVHKKVGVTLNSKGLVGINTNKNCLIHFTLGTPEKGGDQFPSKLLSMRETLLIKTQRKLSDILLSSKNPIYDSIYKFSYQIYRKFIRPWYGTISKDKLILDAGNWNGNESAWRMVSDLMHIAIFADNKGVLHSEPQRKIFSVVDGIIGGENNGPLTPECNYAGIIAAGYNPIAVDVVCTALMGLNHKKIKSILNLLDGPYGFDSNNIIIYGGKKYSNVLKMPGKYLDFKPHPGWLNIKN